jgi:nicotinamidase-related amidase
MMGATSVAAADSKAVLLIVDMQNDFVHPGGPMSVPTAEEVVPKVRDILDSFRRRKLPVIHVIREHRQDASDVEISRIEKFKQRNYALKGTKGAEIIDELKPVPGEIVLPKKRFSAFFMTELPLILDRIGPEYVVIAGIQTPNCIRHTAVDSLCHDFKTIIVSDATTAATPEVHQSNLADMDRMGIQVLTIEQVGRILAS